MKKSLSALLLLLLVVCISVKPQVVEASIQPRLPICGRCNQGVLVPYPNYQTTSWLLNDQLNCKHGFTYGYDHYYIRTVTDKYACNFCSFSYLDSYTDTSRVLCYGKNKI